MRGIVFVGVLTFLVLITPAFALNITLSVDKTDVSMGDTVTLAGKITSDNGTAGKFEYRAAFVAPKRVVVCDSNKTLTAANGSFTLVCKLPTAAEANTLGIPAALDRAVIPYVAGVAVNDTTENATVKKHTRAIIARNPDKLATELDNIVKQLDNFITQVQKFRPECDAIAERATKFNVTDVASRCLEIQLKIDTLVNNATVLKDQASQLKSSLNATSIKDFRDSLKNLKDDMNSLRMEIKELKDSIKLVRWEKLKETKKSADEIKEDIKKKRDEIKSDFEAKRNEIKDERMKEKMEIEKTREAMTKIRSGIKESRGAAS